MSEDELTEFQLPFASSVTPDWQEVRGERMTDAVEAFYARVNARAEADILAGRPVTGAHHRALEAEIAMYRKELGT